MYAEATVSPKPKLHARSYAPIRVVKAFTYWARGKTRFSYDEGTKTLYEFNVAVAKKKDRIGQYCFDKNDNIIGICWVFPKTGRGNNQPRDWFHLQESELAEKIIGNKLNLWKYPLAIRKTHTEIIKSLPLGVKRHNNETPQADKAPAFSRGRSIFNRKVGLALGLYTASILTTAYNSCALLGLLVKIAPASWTGGIYALQTKFILASLAKGCFIFKGALAASIVFSWQVLAFALIPTVIIFGILYGGHLLSRTVRTPSDEEESVIQTV